MKHKIGRFYISDKLVRTDEHHAITGTILRDVVIVRAEYQVWLDAMEYIGYHKEFAPTSVGRMPKVHWPTVTEVRCPDGTAYYRVAWAVLGDDVYQTVFRLQDLIKEKTKDYA